MPRRKRQLPKCSQCGRITMNNSCSHCLRNAEMENDDAFEISIIPQSPEVAQTMKDLCPDDVTCSSCFRISTSLYPLQFVTTQKSLLLTRRSFVTSLHSDSVQLCQVCNNYLNPSASQFQQKPSFKFAWPVVFWKILCEQKVKTCLNILYVEISYRTSKIRI